MVVFWSGDAMDAALYGDATLPSISLQIQVSLSCSDTLPSAEPMSGLDCSSQDQAWNIDGEIHELAELSIMVG